ncbi:FG-GAP repeat domain-containing protein [Actinacidiphila acidipaludis]|uniref:VCBS repeat-containing protein n=1 Tax=Actinacidiphila acidipaludis TaxID=2873382 RepID=A0ABS7Q741_9ACTN|nr:VCBS repeat-containing protein [Streptomyces acidipaludis]MBY8878952.1 VCBS repeat-containing protein [Streptomyces acidipaludis]
MIGLAPMPSALADEAPTPPSISVTATHALDLYGPAQELDVTVASPPTADAYVRLEILGQQTGLHITDDSGTELPLTTGTGNWSHGYVEATIGAQDSDGNGVPGAPLTAGTIRLHISAEYPVSQIVHFTGVVVDGATGAELAVTEPAATGYVQGPRVEPAVPTAVATGQTRPALLDLHTEMWSAKTTPVPAVHTRLVFSADQIAQAGYTADQLVSAVRLSSGMGVAPGTLTPLAWVKNADGSLSADLPTIDWSKVAGNQTDQDLGVQAAWGLPAGKLLGALQVLDTQGRQYAGGTAEFDFTADVRPASLQAAFYGVDGTGTLWQYRGREWVDAYLLNKRQSVGGGWNTYSALTALSPLKANGTGDVVARDRGGVLWYYAGTGTLARPFAARTRVGAGWNTYNLLAGAGDLTGDGRADLLARDSAGVLWLYPGTGKTAAPFTARVRVGAGWGAYNLVTQAGDLTGDGRADLLARDSAGALWLYQGTGKAAAPYGARVRIGTGWNGYTHIVGIGDLLADGHADIIATDKAGELWYYAGTGDAAAPYKPRVAVGTGWSTYTDLV